MATNTIYLITGANRGIGLGLSKILLNRPNTTLIAAVRDPTSASSLALSSLPTGVSSKLIVVKIDSLVETDPKTAVTTLQSQYGISRLDIVIANAGVQRHFGPVTTMVPSELPYHIAVNAVAPVYLLQACLQLLKQAQKPKFIAVSSALGSVQETEKYRASVGAYGASKAALNYLMRKVHFEEPYLITLVICPGWVKTDLGNNSAVQLGLGEEAPVQLEDSVRGIVQEIDDAVRTENGRFASYDHNDHAW